MIDQSALNLDVLMDGDDHRLWLHRRTPLIVPGFEAVQPHQHAMLIYLMVNPSRARGVSIGDPTQRKGDGFTARLGYRRYGFANLFSYSTPYPKNLFDQGYDYAVGPKNDEMLRLLFEWADFYHWPIVCAWGKPSVNKAATDLIERRVCEVMKIREELEISTPLYCLTTPPGDNYPRHPLMLGYEYASLKPWMHL